MTMGGVHLTNLTSLIMKQLEKAKACNLKISIFHNYWIYFNWFDSNTFEMVDEGQNVLNRRA
jgi:hypothetical protein